MAPINKIKGMYDIGIVICINYNYGNNLTNYALFTYFKEKGMSVLLIDPPSKNQLFPLHIVKDKFRSGLFLNNPYLADARCDSYEDRWEVIMINDLCRMFIVGSDQLWRAAMFVEPTDYYTCLDWVYSSKYKASYATSIGTDYYDGDKERFSGLIKRFQRISVREKSAVNIIKEMTGIEGKYVVDPVFLLDRDEYRKLYSSCRKPIKEKKFLCLYFLDRDIWKEKLALRVLNNNNELTGISAMTDALAKGIDNSRINYLDSPYVEEWLELIDKSSFFITDSFHGVCFALIFHKDFLVTFNKNSFRGFERIKVLLEYLGISDRIIFETTELDNINNLVENSVDYIKIEGKLNNFISESREWLDDTITEGKTYIGKNCEYDVLLSNRYGFLHNKYKEQIRVYHEKYNKWIKDINAKDGVVGWCTGYCFYNNIERVKKISNIKYVCDNDKNKWGKELINGVRCIPPDEVYKMRESAVLIFTENLDIVEEIKEQLNMNAIDKHISITEWNKKFYFELLE